MYQKIFISEKQKDKILDIATQVLPWGGRRLDQFSAKWAVVVRDHLPSLSHLNVTREQVEELKPYLFRDSTGSNENPNGFCRYNRVVSQRKIGVKMLKKCGLGYVADGANLVSFHELKSTVCEKKS